MEEKNISFGVRLKKEFTEKIDEIMKNLPDLNTTRSEFLEAITEAFFASKFNHLEKARDFIVTKRKKEKAYESEML